MSMGAMKKAGGGKVQTSADTARKLATEMGGMKKGGKPKANGLAVMIAIGSPMKGMKKPVKKAMGGMASMIPAPDGPPAAATPSGRTAPTNIDISSLARIPARPGVVPSKATPGRRPTAAPSREPMTGMQLQRLNMVSPKAAKAAAAASMMRQKAVDPRINRGPVPADAADPRINRGPAPIAKGGAVKKPVKKMGGGMMYANGGKPDKFAQGGAGKVRKGMMTPEGKIIHAMNKVRGK
jgi:hypothetical protein